MNYPIRVQLLRWCLASVGGLLVMGAALVMAGVLFRLLMVTPRWVLLLLPSASMLAVSVTSVVAGRRRLRAYRERRPLPPRAAF